MSSDAILSVLIYSTLPIFLVFWLRAHFLAGKREALVESYERQIRVLNQRLESRAKED